MIFSDYPKHIKQITQAVLQAVNPQTAVAAHLTLTPHTLHIKDAMSYRLHRGRIFVIAVGKAAFSMGQTALSILGDLVTSAIFIDKQTAQTINDPRIGFVNQQARVLHLLGEHPVSGAGSVQATTAVTELLRHTNENDLVLCLISGGASALLTQPRMPLPEWQQLNQALLASGCTIDAFNTIRRQLDTVKGGGLARLIAPAQCVSLILSDVVGSDVQAIGSGPTAVTHENPNQALALLHQYGQPLPAPLKNKLTRLLQTMPEPTPIDPYRVHNIIVGDVAIATQAAFAQIAKLGFIGRILTTRLQGEAREVGKVMAALAQDLPPQQALILGGETTVTLTGNGKGGRNQELALSAAIALQQTPNTVLTTFATDGDDGYGGAAGGIVTGETAVLAHKHNLNPTSYLANNDSYHFFQKLSQYDPHAHLITGATGTNVNDLVIILNYNNHLS